MIASDDGGKLISSNAVAHESRYQRNMHQGSDSDYVFGLALGACRVMRGNLMYDPFFAFDVSHQRCFVDVGDLTDSFWPMAIPRTRDAAETLALSVYLFLG